MLIGRSARILQAAVFKHRRLMKRAHALAPWLVTDEDVARTRLGKTSERDGGGR